MTTSTPRAASRAALVTGAGSGIGRAIALAFSAAGTDCLITGRRADRLAGTAAAAPGPGRIVAHPSDMTRGDDRAAAVAAAQAAFGRLDILVNNAGVSSLAPLLDVTEDDWRRVMALNLDAAFFLSQAALPLLRESPAGRIVNIGSVYGGLALNAALYDAFPADGPRGPVRQPAYHTSKGGIRNLTRDLAAAVARWRITVNCVSPGMIETEQSRGLLSPEVNARLCAMTPLGRFGTPGEIAAAVLFLASEEAGFVTGAELVADGGWSIW